MEAEALDSHYSFVNANFFTFREGESEAWAIKAQYFAEDQPRAQRGIIRQGWPSSDHSYS